jgi:undecaprenyl phosphate-alpha-L-ara4N flippase subunit ArnE
MSTKPAAIAMVVICTILTSIGMVLWKTAANNGIPELFFTWQLWIGFILYGLGAAILIRSFKDGEVSVLFPIIATSYIWVTLLSNHYFNEAITLFKWLGIAAIVLGITLLGAGRGKK